MPFDWSEYKTLAEELRLRDDEASKRSAISRLYYSVYWKARNLLESEDANFYVRAENSHATVWRGFLNKGIERATIHRNGQQLKEFRIMADYNDPEITNLEQTVDASFKLAERMINTLDTLSGGAPQ